MYCKQARNLFDAYLDGELSPALETELHAHRLNCPSCRQELALMEVAGHVIRSGAAEPPLDAGFTQRLLACLEPVVGRPRHRRNWVIRISCGLAAAACLTLFIVSMGGPEPRVAGRVEANGTAPAPASAEEPQVAAGCPELEAAAVELQRTVEDAVVGTHESSASLVRLGTKTLQELIEVLELEDLRESDTSDIRTDGADAEEDADDVEDI